MYLYSVVVRYFAFNHSRAEIRENHGVWSIDEPVYITDLCAIVAFSCVMLFSASLQYMDIDQFRISNSSSRCPTAEEI
jgi:hypothetical protein